MYLKLMEKPPINRYLEFSNERLTLPKEIAYNKEDLRTVLVHYGIRGQEWGKRNGPPYPLSSEAHSNKEKKVQESKSKGLTDKQKRAIKVGIAVTATAIAAIGLYELNKHGKLDKLKELGKAVTESALFTGEAPNANDVIIKAERATVGFKGRLPRAETREEAILNANPLYGAVEGKNNCALSAIAGYLRQQGIDITAGSTPGLKQVDAVGIVQDCFSGGYRHLPGGSAAKIARSKQDASEYLLRKFGKNAQGIISIQWTGDHGGHTFSWEIKNGVVEFFDMKDKRENVDNYWTDKEYSIDPTKRFDIIGFTNAKGESAKIRPEGIEKWFGKNREVEVHRRYRKHV